MIGHPRGGGGGNEAAVLPKPGYLDTRYYDTRLPISTIGRGQLIN
jgi:hypothetical protein